MPAKRAVPTIEFKPVKLTQAFGIQPIIVHPDGSIWCNLFNLYRKYQARKYKNKKIVRGLDFETATPRYIWHYKSDEEKQEIVKNAVNYYQLTRACMNKILEVGKHINYDLTVDEFIQQGMHFVTNRVFTEALACFVYNKLVNGNKFISSNEELLKKIKPYFHITGIVEKILVPDAILPRDTLVISARGGMTFDNGILLCPLIYEAEFNKWMYEKGKSLEIPDKKFRDYPIMREYRYKMDLWGEYINDWIPLEWHFEVFEKNARYFHRIIHFKR